MSYSIFYILFALISISFGMRRAFKILLIGCFVDLVSDAWYYTFELFNYTSEQSRLFYVVLFLIYSLWMFVFDHLKYRASAISIGMLCVVTGLVFVSESFSGSDPSVIYVLYPVIIGILNALIIFAGLYDDRHAGLANIGRVLSNNKKNHGANL